MSFIPGRTQVLREEHWQIDQVILPGDVAGGTFARCQQVWSFPASDFIVRWVAVLTGAGLRVFDCHHERSEGSAVGLLARLRRRCLARDGWVTLKLPGK